MLDVSECVIDDTARAFSALSRSDLKQHISVDHQIKFESVLAVRDPTKLYPYTEHGSRRNPDILTSTAARGELGTVVSRREARPQRSPVSF